MVDILENDGHGLNLTAEVRSGILHHTGGGQADTLEGQVIRFADRIAYINHDIDDAMRAGILQPSDLPREICRVLGATHRARINTLVENIIACSGKSLQMEPQVAKAMADLREFMFARVYKNPVAKREERKAQGMLQQLYSYYLAHPEQLPPDFRTQLDFDGMPRVVCDYIAGMTDKYAIYKFNEIFIPATWQPR